MSADGTEKNKPLEAGPEGQDQGGSQGDLIDQDELNSLLASLTGQTPEEAAAIAAADAPAETPPAPDAQPSPDEDRAEPIMDEIIGGADAESPLDQSSIDDVLADVSSLGDADMDRVIPIAPGPVAAAELDERPRPADAEPSHEVVNENLSAAAGPVEELLSHDLIDALMSESAASTAAPSPDELAPVIAELPESETAEALSEKEVADAIASAAPAPPVPAAESPPRPTAQPSAEKKPKPPRKPWLTPEMRHALRKHFVKAAVSLLVGILAGGGAYWGLSRLTETAPTSDALSALQQYDLRTIIRTAQSMIQGGQYAEAVAVLAPAIEQAADSPAKLDARYLLLDAQMRMLPEQPTVTEAEQAHIAIDALVGEAPSHPGAAAALRWKATLYERADMDHAAHGTYGEILAHHGNANDVDRVLFDAARLALQMGRADEAADHLRRLLQQFPGSPVAGQGKLMLGEAYAAAGEQDQARAVFQQIMDTQPENALGAAAAAKLGALAFDAKRYEEAITLLNRQIDTGLATGDVHLLLAKSYMALDRLAEAEQTLNDMLAFLPESAATPLAYVELSRVYEARGERGKALRVAQQAADRYPQVPAVLTNASEMLALTGQTLDAARALVAADSAGGNDAAHLLRAGRMFAASDELTPARDAFERLLAQYPTAPEAFEGGIDLARVLRGQGQVRKAVDRLESLSLATEGKPQQIPVLVALGEMYHGLGLYERSAAVFKRVADLAVAPKDLANAAVVLFDASLLDDALAVAARVDPAQLGEEEAYRFLQRYGSALLSTNPALGIEKLELAYEKYPAQRTPDDGFALLSANLAADRSARARALVMEAYRQYREAPVDAPQFQRNAVAWGDYLYAKSDYRAAAEAYGMAVEAGLADDEDTAWAQFQHANTLLKLDDLAGCLPMFETVAGGNSPWADEAKARADYVRLEQRLRGAPAPASAAAGEG